MQQLHIQDRPVVGLPFLLPVVNKSGCQRLIFTLLLKVQNQKFSTLSCTNCGFTELYRMDGRGVGNIFDTLTN